MVSNPNKLTVISQPVERKVHEEREDHELEEIISELETDNRDLEAELKDIAVLENVIEEFPDDVALALQEVLDRTSDDRILRKRMEAFCKALRRESSLKKVGVASPPHFISNLVILSLQGASNL